MQNKILIAFVAVATMLTLMPANAQAATMAETMKGKILLQVEANGEAWYVNPVNSKRYYLGRPDDAFSIMRSLGLGAKHSFITAYTIFPARVSGRILIDVDDSGKAYYINPTDRKAHYLGRPADAFDVMRKLGKGISNSNLAKIADSAASGTLWNAWDAYVTAANNKDFDALQNLSSTPLDLAKDCYTMTATVCKDTYMQFAKEALNDNPKIEQATATVYESARQGIIVSPLLKEVNANDVTGKQQMAYFAKDNSDTWKLIRTIFASSVLSKDGTKTDDQLKADLDAKYLDTDQDGLSDAIETGTDLSENSKTNKDLRDTDGDGWWDGMEFRGDTDPLIATSKIY